MDSDFRQRLQIPIDIEDAKTRFVNRVYKLIFEDLFNGDSIEFFRFFIIEELQDEFGIYRSNSLSIGSQEVREIIGQNFDRSLRAVEIFYDKCGDLQEAINQRVQQILSDSEIVLGICWMDGKFYRSGAKLLDERLVGDPLRWLSGEKYKSVKAPFEKGLRHYLSSEQRPEVLSDVITDMYESLEALAKIVTRKENGELSKNRENFVKAVNASEEYKKILKEYIAYANNFRHAEVKKEKPILSKEEVESFIYLTGLFLRLGILKENQSAVTYSDNGVTSAPEALRG